jgi:ABC-2 type transport system permease protein
MQYSPPVFSSLFSQIWSVIKRYGAIYKVQLANNWVREVVYRTNFLTNFIVDVIWIAVEFTLFTVIYANTDSLGGWSKHQVYFFLGVLFASDALFTIFFTRNLWLFNDLVNKGELDILLTKPVHPLFLAFTRWMNLTAISNFALGLGIAIRFAPEAGFAGGWHWLQFPLWMGISLATALALRFAFTVWVFWTDRSWAISRLYYQFFGFATKPDAIYPKAVRYTIMTILPFAFIGSVPARAMMEGLSLGETLLVFGVLVGFWFFNRFMWNRGLMRYQSASS